MGNQDASLHQALPQPPPFHHCHHFTHLHTTSLHLNWNVPLTHGYEETEWDVEKCTLKRF